MRRERGHAPVAQGASRPLGAPKATPAGAGRDGTSPLDVYSRLWSDAASYWTDAWQRGVLYLDVMRQRGNQYHEHMAEKAPHVLSFTGDLVADGRKLRAPGQLRAGPDHPARGRHGRHEEAAVRGRRPARRARARDRRLQGRQRDRRGAAGRPPLLLRRLPAEPGARPDDRGRDGAPRPRFLERVAELHPEAEGKPVVVGNCQAGWADPDDRRDPARAVRPDHRRRLAALLLGRRARREPDALLGRAARRELAHRARGRPRQRHLRRRLAGPELRGHEPRQHALDQAVQPLLEDRHRGPSATSASRSGGAATSCSTPRRCSRSSTTCSSATSWPRQSWSPRTGSGSTCARSARRSSASAPRATTSPRRSRRWAGSPTSTPASTTSAPTARPSSTASTRASATSASSSPAAWRRRSTRSSRPTSTSSTSCRPASTRR